VKKNFFPQAISSNIQLTWRKLRHIQSLLQSETEGPTGRRTSASEMNGHKLFTLPLQSMYEQTYQLKTKRHYKVLIKIYNCGIMRGRKKNTVFCSLSLYIFFAEKVSGNFKICKYVHHHTIQINQPTSCNNSSSVLLDVYVQLNMFRASSCPSSGAQQLQ